MEKEDYLPLFLTLKEPIVIYVVDNEIIGCQKYHDVEAHPYIIKQSYQRRTGHCYGDSAFHYLKILFQSSIGREVFPQELHHHFKDVTIHKERYYQRLVTSFEGGQNQHSLGISLTIDENKDLPVIIDDIVYKESKIDKTIYLNAKDAFFTFAIICANAYCDGIVPIRKGKSKSSLEKHIHNHVIRPYRNFGEAFGKTPSFAKDFILYLSNELQKGSISCEYILRMSGPRLLVYLAELQPVQTYLLEILEKLNNSDRLSREKKIIYFTIFRLLSRFESTNSQIAEQLIAKKHILDELANTFEKDFPGREVVKTTGYLPLFINNYEGCALIVIDNKIVGCNPRYLGTDQYPDRPFQILCQLYQSPVTRDAIPERFHKYFESICQGFDKKVFGLLVGLVSEGAQRFDLKVEIREDNPLPVRLHGMRFNSINLGLELELTAKDAFTIFANLLANSRAVGIEELFGTTIPSFSDLKAIHEKQEQKYDEFLSTVPQEHKETMKKQHDDRMTKLHVQDSFTMEYLMYLLEVFTEGKSSPYDILCKSGIRLLSIMYKIEPISSFIHEIIDKLKNYEALSRNERFMFYTLLSVLDYETSDVIINQFFSENKNVFLRLEDHLRKKFPRNERKILLNNFERESLIDSEPLEILSKKEEMIDLPFFISRKYNILIYLFNNEIVICKEFRGIPDSANRAHYLLRQLFKSQIGRSGFPDRFHDLFKNLGKIFGEGFCHCLTGTGGKDEILHDCLEVEFNVNVDEKLIEFSNFIYNENPLKFKVKVSPSEAFHLLANICVSDLTRDLGTYIKNPDKYDIEKIRDLHTKESKAIDKRLGRKLWSSIAETFAIEYFDYLIKGLIEGKITPSEILRLSGPAVLAFLQNYEPVKKYLDEILAKIIDVEKLTRNEQILYFTLLETLSLDRVRDFYKNNRNLILGLKKKFYTAFSVQYIQKKEKKIEIIEEIIDESTIPIKDAIEEARKKKHKIVLVKAHDFSAAMSDISSVLAHDDYKIKYPRLQLSSLVQRLLHNRKESDMKKYSLFEKLEYKPPITKVEVYNLLLILIDEDEKGETIKIGTGEKIKFHGEHSINPLWKDILSIEFLGDTITKGILDENSIKTIIEALYDLSKNRVLILIHPNIKSNIASEQRLIAFGLKPIPFPFHLMKDFMNSAIVASDEPM